MEDQVLEQDSPFYFESYQGLTANQAKFKGSAYPIG